jgi:hypothetical protein
VSARDHDYLARFSRLSSRVTAIETGAHPLQADVDYFKTEGPYSLPDESAIFSTGGGGVLPGWIMKLGAVHLFGQFHAVAAGWALLGATEQLTTIPKRARPLTNMLLTVAVSKYPYYATLSISNVDGVVTLIPPDPVPISDAYVDLYSVHWPIG